MRNIPRGHSYLYSKVYGSVSISGFFLSSNFVSQFTPESFIKGFMEIGPEHF